jgi:hypothetical protein
MEPSPVIMSATAMMSVEMKMVSFIGEDLLEELSDRDELVRLLVVLGESVEEPFGFVLEARFELFNLVAHVAEDLGLLLVARKEESNKALTIRALDRDVSLEGIEHREGQWVGSLANAFEVLPDELLGVVELSRGRLHFFLNLG